MTDTMDVAAFAALGDSTRWAILQRVGRDAASASALAEELPVSRQAIMRHLGVLEEAGLVESTWLGRERRYAGLGERLSHLARTLESVGRGWEVRLEGIKAAAEREEPR